MQLLIFKQGKTGARKKEPVTRDTLHVTIREIIKLLLS
jgi:hypothetical protein